MLFRLREMGSNDICKGSNMINGNSIGSNIMQNIEITGEAPTIVGQIPIASGVAVGENRVRTGVASTLFAVTIWLFASPRRWL